MNAEGRATVAPELAATHEDAGFSVAQYAEREGISTDSVRRRLKAGELAGHQRPTKHGMAWCIHPDGLPRWRDGRATVVQTVAQESREGGATVAQGSTDLEGDQDAANDGSEDASTAPALMQAEAMAVYTRSVLEPLVAALERSEGRVAELERENGVLSERADGLTRELARANQETDALRAAQAHQEARRATEELVTATDSPWKRWWPVLLGVLALVAAVALVGWPR